MNMSGYHTEGGMFGKETRRHIIKRVVQDLRNVDFDAIAARGVSGLIIVPTIAYLLNKHVIVVRKEKDVEPSHGVAIETLIDQGKYIIVDDFVGGGTTVNTIVTMLKTHIPLLKCVGGYCYYPGKRFKCDTFNNTIPCLNP